MNQISASQTYVPVTFRYIAEGDGKAFLYQSYHLRYMVASHVYEQYKDRIEDPEQHNADLISAVTKGGITDAYLEDGPDGEEAFIEQKFTDDDEALFTLMHYTNGLMTNGINGDFGEKHLRVTRAGNTKMMEFDGFNYDADSAPMNDMSAEAPVPGAYHVRVCFFTDYVTVQTEEGEKTVKTMVSDVEQATTVEGDNLLTTDFVQPQFELYRKRLIPKLS